MADGETATGSLAPMDIRRILTLLPHRYPMLLVDRVESMVKDQSIHARSEEHTSELQSLMRISYAVFCLKKKKIIYTLIKLRIIYYLDSSINVRNKDNI